MTRPQIAERSEECDIGQIEELYRLFLFLIEASGGQGGRDKNNASDKKLINRHQ